METIQNHPPNWGLDRIDQAKLPLNSSYEYKYDGTGVKVFVLDSGISSTHKEFGNRSIPCANFFDDEDCDDAAGHGTHVAGTIGGLSMGVAKNVDLVNVKVLGDGGGSFSGVIAGVDFVIQEKKTNPNTPMVINMSLGVRFIRIHEFEDIVNEAIASGIVVVVAAGNSAKSACMMSPAYIPSAITVAASDTNDFSATFSNHGKCVDIYAPGVHILSASATDDESYTFLQGTSMAAPHVAGAAALYLQANPEWTPAQVWNAMRDDAVETISFRPRLRPLKLIARIFRTRRTTKRLLQTQHI